MKKKPAKMSVKGIIEQIQQDKEQKKVKVGFLIDADIHSKFMELCAKHGVAASRVIELFMVDWNKDE